MRTSRNIAAAAIFTLFFGLTAAAATLGAGVTSKEVVSVSAILENPTRYVGKTVAVAGTIVEVCAARGCWIDLAGDKPHQTLRIKVDDGVIVFPLDAKGKVATAEGIFTRIDVPAERVAEMKRHEAEEKGVPFDPKSVKGPEVVYQIRGTGAVVR
jgi:hypothetical protein